MAREKTARLQYALAARPRERPPAASPALLQFPMTSVIDFNQARARLQESPCSPYSERQEMTARFAYRMPRVSAETPATAKATRSPALPAASLPEGSLPAQEDAFKEVCVFRAGGVGRTTISIPMGEYEHMLSFAGESHEAVEKACVEASLVLEPVEGSSWTEIVAAGAMLELMLAFQARRKVKPGRKAK